MSDENTQKARGLSRGTSAPQGSPGQGQAPQQEESSQSSGEQVQGYSPSSPEYAQDGRAYQEDPEWKKAQRGYTRTIQELQQQVQAMRSEQEKLRMSGMSELEQARYAAEQWRKEAENQARAVQAIQTETARMRDLNDIQAATGVPAKAIADYLEEIGSNSAHDAWTWAYQQRNKVQGQQYEPQGGLTGPKPAQFNQQTSARQAPPVNVGGGPAPSAQHELQAEYDRAKSLYNMGDMFAAMQKAGQLGIELRE